MSAVYISIVCFSVVFGDCRYSQLAHYVTCGFSWNSREFIRAAYGDPYMSVTSPTYLLQNIYDDIEGGETA